MKNRNTAFIAFGLLFIILTSGLECPNNDTSPGNSLSSWTVGTLSYSSSSAARATSIGNALSISDGTDNSGIAIYFLSFPTVTGTYHVAKYSTGGNPSSTLAGDELSVDATINGGADDYLSTGSGNVDAAVTVTDGKINVTLPALWGQHFDGSGSHPDSLQVSGTIVEK